MNSYFTVLAATAACGGLFLSAAQAQPNNRTKTTYTNAAEADADFAYQGEYLGLTTGVGGHAYTGLQVIARGDGNFEAVLLPGGLPGAGWNRQSKFALSGALDGDELTLNGDGYSVRIQPPVATLDGSRSGRLESIHRISSTQGKRPPRGATILFDGREPTNLEGAKLTDDGLLMAGTTTAMPVGDFRLHVEFRSPYMPYATGQSRGNSGVYIQRRYEVQILDSFGLEGVANECGGLYRQQAADVNMCFPPLSWQTYDIQFIAAKFENGKKTASARITVLQNGEPIHSDREIKGKTGAGKQEGPEPLPIHFQFHGDQVHYRNIWLVHGIHRLPPSEYCVPRRISRRR